MILTRKFTATMIIIYFVVQLSSPLVSGAASNSDKLKTTSSVNDTAAISINIQQAYYLDLDDDSYEDDVYALVSIKLQGSATYTFDYQVTLTLPSGISFTYQFIITTNIESLSFNNNFYDHALELGYYRIDINVKLHTGGQFKDDATYIFDPPGGACCSDPTFTLT